MSVLACPDDRGETLTLNDTLHGGLARPDTTGRRVIYRYLRPTDDAEQITVMLHEAYGPLAEAGMRFVASHQDVETTRRRMAKGQTIVATLDDEIIGIITLAGPEATNGTPFLDRAEVASFGQFAVRPAHQRHGIGSTLMALVEELAREQGVAKLALNTSEHAAHLIAFYKARGFEFVEYCQWPMVNYRSIVLSKRLRPQDPELGDSDSAR